MARSFECDDLVPKNPDMVRAEILMAGWVLIPQGRYTIVTYIVQIDLKVKIPTSVVNVVSVKQPMCIHYLRQAMEEGKEQPPRKGSVSSNWGD